MLSVDKHLLMLNYKHQNRTTAKIQLLSEQQHLPLMRVIYLTEENTKPKSFSVESHRKNRV